MEKVLIISSNKQKMRDIQEYLQGSYRVQTLPLLNSSIYSEVTGGIPDCIIVIVETLTRTKLFGMMDFREQEDIMDVPLLLIADDEDEMVFRQNVHPGLDAVLRSDASMMDIRLSVERLCATSATIHHVLIVDDDPVSLKLVRSYLDETYRVNCVKSGMLALKFLEKQKPDLILLDCYMPEMNGAQTLQAIRAIPRLKGTPVVFLTGNSDREMVMSCLSLHPSGFLVKPVKKEDLLAKIKEVI
ncbi:MAG: response regulator [Lachnospiraceae bacterium]|nr:response regulator [Lachnospiraceae bacterium]